MAPETLPEQPLAIVIPPQAVDELVESVADRVLELLNVQAGDAWIRGEAAAADYLDCKKSRVGEFVRRKEIPHHRDGRWVMFRRSELDVWVRAGGAKRLGR